MNLLEEVQNLELFVEKHRSIELSYADTVPDCETAVEHRMLADWLEELLEIKKARLSVEVFMEQSYHLMPDEEPASDDANRCTGCGKYSLTQRGPKMICSNCGRVRTE